MRRLLVALLVACGARSSLDGAPTGGLDASVADVSVSDVAFETADDVSQPLDDAPRGLLFHNQEDDPTLASGVAVITPPLDDSDVITYRIDRGDGTTTLSLLAEVPKSNPVYEIDDWTPRPTGATTLLAFSATTQGVEAGPATASLTFVPPSYVDIDKGDFYVVPQIAFDPVSGHLVMVMGIEGQAGQLVSFNCPEDLSSCSRTVLPAVTTKAWPSQLLVDGNAGRFTFLTAGGVFMQRDLSGVSCSTVGPGAGIEDNYPNAALTFDESNNRFIGALKMYAEDDVRVFFTSSTLSGYTNMDVDGETSSSGVMPALVIDSANAKLLIAQTGGFSNEQLALLRCGLDGTGCAMTNMGPVVPTGVFVNPPLLIDGSNLLSFVQSFSEPNIDEKLYVSNLDGTAAAVTDLTGLITFEDVDSPVSPALDAVGHRAIASFAEWTALPMMVRCKTTGANCRTRQLDSQSGVQQVSAAIDPTTRMLFTVAPLAVSTYKLLRVIQFGI